MLRRFARFGPLVPACAVLALVGLPSPAPALTGGRTGSADTDDQPVVQCTAQPQVWPQTICTNGYVTSGGTTTNLHPLIAGANAGSWGPASSPYSVLAHDAVLQQYSGNPNLTIHAVRLYNRWDQAFLNLTTSTGATSDPETMVQNGMTIFISVQARYLNGTYIPWENIAQATPTNTNSTEVALYKRIVYFANQLKAFGAANAGLPGAEVYFIFNHEPEIPATGSPVNGNATAYRAAWQNIWTQFHALGVTNVKYVWTVTGWGLRAQGKYAAVPFYPGYLPSASGSTPADEQYVDYIAEDDYNWDTCHNGTWQPFSFILTGQEPGSTTPLNGIVGFGQQHPTKGLLVMEYDSMENPSSSGQTKAQWMAAAAALFNQPEYQQFWSFLIFGPPGLSSCNFTYNSSPAAAQEWANISSDPHFGATTLPALNEVTVSGTQVAGTPGVTWATTVQPEDGGTLSDDVPGLDCDVIDQTTGQEADPNAVALSTTDTYAIDPNSCLSDGLYSAGSPDSQNAISNYLAGTFTVAPSGSATPRP